MNLTIDDIVILTSENGYDYIDVVVSMSDLPFDTTKYQCRTFHIIDDIGYCNNIKYKLKEVYRYDKKEKVFKLYANNL